MSHCGREKVDQDSTFLPENPAFIGGALALAPLLRCRTSPGQINEMAMFLGFFSQRAKVGLNATLLLRMRVQKYCCCPPASEYSKCTNHSVDYHGFLAGERSRSTSHLHILPAFWLVLILNTAQNPVFTV